VLNRSIQLHFYLFASYFAKIICYLCIFSVIIFLNRFFTFVLLSAGVSDGSYPVRDGEDKMDKEEEAREFER
jgi:hypothetical protein